MAQQHLDSFTIGQFRGLRGLKLESLAPVNLLVGLNNSGKTSVLEALAIFGNPMSLPPLLNAAWRRENREPTDPFFDALEWLFPHPGENQMMEPFRGSILLAGNGSYGVAEHQISYKTIERIPARSGEVQPGSRIDFSTHLRDGQLVTGGKPLELWNEIPTPIVPSPIQALPVSVVTIVSHRFEPLERHLSEATLKGEKAQLIQLLRSIDGGIRDVQLLTPRNSSPRLYVEHRDHGVVPMSIMGDGIRRALAMALALISCENGLLLIDEIESSIHTSVLGGIFQWLVLSCQRLDVQLFATTHSLEAIDAILDSEGEHLGRVAAYRLEERKGRIEAQRLDGDLLYRLRFERGLDVRGTGR